MFLGANQKDRTICKYSLIGNNGEKLQQPEIELLVTNKFGFTPTGSRTLTGLTKELFGPNGYTLKSGLTLSPLFGEAVKIGTASGVHLDVTDDSLSFTGDSTSVGPFTMGIYVWGPFPYNDFSWFLIVPHSLTTSGDFYWDFQQWRLAILYYGDGVYWGAIARTATTGDGADYTTHQINVPDEQRSGWIHEAFTYDPSAAGGTLKGYANGVLAYTKTNYAFTAYGSGAYVSQYFISLFLTGIKFVGQLNSWTHLLGFPISGIYF